MMGVRELSVFVRIIFFLLMACGSALAESESEPVSFVQIESLADLGRSLKSAAGKPALVRVKADWSVSSIELAKHFALKTLQDLLVDVILLELDVTEYTDDHREFLSQYDIFGPPHLLFFDESGIHIVGKDVAGYQTPEGLENGIRDALSISPCKSLDEQ